MSDEEPSVSEPAAGKGKAVEKVAKLATAVMAHRELLVAAMELLRDRQALDEQDEAKIVAAYEQSPPAGRFAIHELLERLQKVHVGKVLIGLTPQAEGEGPAADEPLAATVQRMAVEARPYLQNAKMRLAELKSVQEPTMKSLEVISANLKDTSREVVKGLKGVGKEAADELIRRGRSWWMDAETEELQREFFDWTLKSMPRAEQFLVRLLVASGLIVFFVAVMIAARQLRILEEMLVYVSIAVLLILGFVFLNWGFKVSEWIKSGRSEMEKLAKMTPEQRRVVLAQRWATRAEQEGVIDHEEATRLFEETLHAAAEAEPETRGTVSKSP